MLLAGLAIAAEYGTRNYNETVRIAEDLHVDGPGDNSRKLQNLPRSCSESAANLRRQRHFYEANGIFPRNLVDSILSRLENYGDKNLWKTLSSKPEMFETLVAEYMHYG
jgi:glutamine synthetase